MDNSGTSLQGIESLDKSRHLVLHHHNPEDDSGEISVSSFAQKWNIEIVEQWKLGLPITIAYLFQTMIPFITYLFIGHLENDADAQALQFDSGMLQQIAVQRGVPLNQTEINFASSTWSKVFEGYKGEPEELAAIGLASTSANVLGYSLLVGFTGALRTFCSQSYGAGQYHLVGVYFQRGLFVTSLACIPIAVLFQVAGPALAMLGVDPRVALRAGEYLRYLCINLWPYGWFQCIQKYLQTQGIITPITVCTGVVAALSIPVNYIFISKFGMQAGPFITLFSFTLMDILLVLYIIKTGAHKQTWGGWTWEATRKVPEYLAIAIPGLVMTCTEWWGFEVITLMAGRITLPDGSPDPTALATQTTLLQSNAFLFALPLGLSVATAVRVGSFLGMNFPKRAKRSTFVAFAMVVLVMLALAALQIGARNYWGSLFTSNDLVIAQISKIIILSSLFEVMDGAVSVGSGVLRGAGKQRFGAIVNGVAYWVVGLPLAYVLCFILKWGLYGLWAGMSAALLMQVIVLFYRFYSLKWQRECDRAQSRAQLGEKEKKENEIQKEQSFDRFTMTYNETLAHDYKIDSDGRSTTRGSVTSRRSLIVDDRSYFKMDESRL